MRWKDRFSWQEPPYSGCATSWASSPRQRRAKRLPVRSPIRGGVVVVPAFTGLGTPYWDPQARGTILGLTLGSTKAHVTRATLEAIALQTRDVVETMQQESGVALQELRADGGATANALLMQTQADLLGIPVVVPAVTETTALGAAYLAGLGVGFWPDAAAVAAQWRVARRYEPQISADERESLLCDVAARRRTRPRVGNRLVASGRYHKKHTPTTAQPVIKIALRRSCCDKVVCKVHSTQRNNLRIRHH